MRQKTKGEHFTGLEIQAESADMARRSVAYNHLEERVDIVTGDIRTASELFPKSSFDVITSNPPYMNHMHGIQNPGGAKSNCTPRNTLFTGGSGPGNKPASAARRTVLPHSQALSSGRNIPDTDGL